MQPDETYDGFRIRYPLYASGTSAAFIIPMPTSPESSRMIPEAQVREDLPGAGAHPSVQGEIDETLLLENLRRSPAERLRDAAARARSLEVLRAAQRRTEA